MSGRWWRAMLVVNVVLFVGFLLTRAGSDQPNTLAAGSSATTATSRQTASSIFAPDSIPLLDAPTIAAEPPGGTGPVPTGFRGLTGRGTFFPSRSTSRFVPARSTGPTGASTSSPTSGGSSASPPPTTRQQPPPNNGRYSNPCDDPAFRQSSGLCGPRTSPTTRPPTTTTPTTAPTTTTPTTAPTTTTPTTAPTTTTPTTAPPTTTSDPPTTDP